MERIDVLWDAWEDCLCKAELRAEFDRLTGDNEWLRAENKKFADHIVENMAGRRPDFSGLIEADSLREKLEKAQAENEKIEKSRQAYIKILDETMLENEELQSHLDRICEPIKRESRCSRKTI